MSNGGRGGWSDAVRRRRLGAAASVGLLAVAAVLALVGGNGQEPATPESEARIVSADELGELQDSLGHHLYWAGHRTGQDLELATEDGGSVYLRYLPKGIAAGDPRQNYLTVGTYPVPDAQGALERVASENGVEPSRADDGALILPNPSSRGSVYLAYPGSDLEIEVFHPEPGRAMKLIRSGAIEPVGE